METEQPKRKDVRLKGYDYNAKGAYFITICVKDRKPILSSIVKPLDDISHDTLYFHNPVGVGAFDDPRILLTEIGRIVRKNLLSSENILGVKIDRYVIMPDHIHAIIFLDPKSYADSKDGSSRAPTPTNQMLPHVISTFKRFCNKEIGENIFQRGYMEHIIRDRDDYNTKRNYIFHNPNHWSRNA